MPKVPATCTNPACGIIFQDQGIVIEGGSHITLSGNTTVCPRCGSQARYVEGTFNVINGLFDAIHASEADRKLLRELGLMLVEIYKSGNNAEAAAKRIEPLSPTLADSLRRLAYDPDRLTKVIVALIALLAAVIINDKKTINIGAREEIVNQVIITQNCDPLVHNSEKSFHSEAHKPEHP